MNKFLFENFLNEYLGSEEKAMDFLRTKAVLDIAGSDKKVVVQAIHMYVLPVSCANECNLCSVVLSGQARAQLSAFAG